MLDRGIRAAERRIKDANFPVIKTINSYDFDTQPPVSEALVQEHLGKREDILLVGNPGTGKTHLVCALAFSACAQGQNVRFHTAMDLVTQLVECREEKRLQRRLKQLQGLHLLLFDELGYVPSSKAGIGLLLEVISRVYEHHGLMMTTNLAFGFSKRSRFWTA